MYKLTISIFGNQIFAEILKEIKLFSKYKLIFYDNLDIFEKNIVIHEHLIIFYITESNKKYYKKIENNNFPIIIVANNSAPRSASSSALVEKLNTPFSIVDLEKKIISLAAKSKFRKASLINLGDYTIDKNERRIRKDNLMLQLTEKEINFLILFSDSKQPISRNFILKNVWKYSSKSDTHTVETHIYRLRQKFLKKFNDSNFIKNNDKGYYI